MRSRLAITVLFGLSLACASPSSSAPNSEEAPAQPAAAPTAELAEAEDAVDGDKAAGGEAAAAASDKAPARPMDAESSKPGGTAQVAGDIEVGVPALNDGLNRDIIRRKVLDHADDVRSCFGRALAAQADLGAQLIVSVDLDEDGRVTKAALSKDSALNNADVEACALALIESWEFGPTGEGASGNAEISITLK